MLRVIREESLPRFRRFLVLNFLVTLVEITDRHFGHAHRFNDVRSNRHFLEHLLVAVQILLIFNGVNVVIVEI